MIQIDNFHVELEHVPKSLENNGNKIQDTSIQDRFYLVRHSATFLPYIARATDRSINFSCGVVNIGNTGSSNKTGFLKTGPHIIFL